MLEQPAISRNKTTHFLVIVGDGVIWCLVIKHKTHMNKQGVPCKPVKPGFKKD
jgi:hypothetical protein